ncbi:MAG TPA: S8 family serine peptidase [Deinococcales bacterium]|nr:S8 family serine peptidase [Deinococcales bacterium]
MKARWVAGLTATIALAACGQQAAPPQDVQQEATGPARRYIIVYKDQAIPLKPLAAAPAARLQKTIPQLGVATAVLTPAQVTALKADPSVAAVGRERMYTLPPEKTFEAGKADAASPGVKVAGPTADDFLWGRQWDIRRVGAPAAWQRVPANRQAKVTVAILDTGVMDDHPDLQGQLNLKLATNYCPETGGPNNSPAYPIYTRVFDFLNTVDTPLCVAAPDTAYHFHGTHVSGTVAAKFGGGGVVGVAPYAKIAAYKVFDRVRYMDGTTLVDDEFAWDGPLFAAIADASDRGIPVLNMSLGGLYDSQNPADAAELLAWQRAMKFALAKGTLIVTSAGNEGAELGVSQYVRAPGELPEAFDVSATGVSQLTLGGGFYDAVPGTDVLAEYSNYGRPIDIAAPGGDCGPTGICSQTTKYHLILSDAIDDSGGPTSGQATYYYVAGTSMAAPHVAGAAALVKAQYPTWTPAMIRFYLQMTADRIGSSYLFGAGLVNVQRATMF